MLHRSTVTETRCRVFGWGVKKITTAELAEKMGAGKVVLIDVREPSEFKGGRINGAINIPLGQLRTGVAKYDPAAETFLICASGSRSATAAKQLKSMGFENAYSVAGGMAAWRGKVKR
ncbi:MAG: rhodanese-like domain-containing protein [Coriobacteriia bacterium]|nr:rhodanese-like domain-containing protein [Coriobacteriia bacterium]